MLPWIVPVLLGLAVQALFDLEGAFVFYFTVFLFGVLFFGVVFVAWVFVVEGAKIDLHNQRRKGKAAEY